jgi:hypothetical protein
MHYFPEAYENSVPLTREAAVLEALKLEREIDPEDFVKDLIEWSRATSSVMAADILAIASESYLGGHENFKIDRELRRLHREIEDIWRWSMEVAA